MKAKYSIFTLLTLFVYITVSAGTWTDANGTKWYFTTNGSNATISSRMDNGNFISSISGTIPTELSIPAIVYIGESPYTVNAIGESAFAGCSRLKSIIIPKGITSIGSNAFDGCTSLTSITIPEGVTSIGEWAFHNCSKLKSVTIPDGVTSIGAFAFYHCSNLISITIPEGITSIGDYVFSGCSNLNSITLPDGVTSIGAYAFQNCKSIANITIPESVISIGSNAFSACACLTSFVIPNGVTSISQSTFSGCTSLTFVTIPNGITTIGWAAFYNCRSLTNISIPSSMTDIGEKVFHNCKSLKSIECLSFFPIDILTETFSTDVYSSATLYVPTGAKAMYQAADGWKQFASIVEKEMDGVDREFFEYIVTSDNSVSVKAKTQKLMGKIEIPSEVSLDGKVYQITSIAYNGFENCKGVTSFVLPESLTEINSYAFWGCASLEQINIPQNVDSFGYGALSNGCNRLKEITVADGNIFFKVEKGLLLNTAGNTAYAYAFGIEKEHLVIPETVKYLRGNLFTGNKRLKTIQVPSGVTYIGGAMFYNCTALEEVMLPDDIKTIESSTFYGCTSLQNVTIPAAMIKDSDGIFSGCTAIRSVTVRQITPLEITSSFFPSEVYANATLYIPKGRRAYYANASGWKEFKNLKEIQMDGIASSDSPYDNIENNQMILGYYSSNECQLAGEDGYGGPQGGLYKVCIGFSKDQIAPFAGNHIKNVRFGLVHTEDMSGVQLWIGSSRDKKDLYTQSINNLQTGWNEIELVDPYTITEDSIFVGIEYRTQYRNYPISCVTTGKEKGSSYLYGPYNNGVYSWLDTGESVSLSMQCLIEGEKLPQNLIRALPPVVNSLYQKSGETISGNVSIKNWGKKNVEDYDIKYQIDGNDVEFTQWNKPSVGRNEYTSLYFELKVPQTLMAGQHRLTSEITQINGMPNQYHSEGGRPTSLKVYTKSYERKKVVIDHLTAQWCPNSVRADKVIEEIMSQHDDIILLTSNLQDNLSCDASESFGIFSEYIPAIYYDRYSSAGATSLGYAGYETAKQQPSLVTVDVSATYNDSDNKLHIKVQGERNDEFADVEGYANLTVLVTEDKIDAPQNDRETGGYDHYEHNGVIRGNASAIWGDPIQWNGNSYDMDFTMPYNSEWNLDNLHIVAFIARPYSGNLGEIHILNSDESKVEVPEKLIVKAYHGFLGDIALNDRFDAKGVTADGASQLIIYSERANSEIMNGFVTFEIDGQSVNNPDIVGTISNIKKMDNGKWGFLYTAPNIFPENIIDYKFELRINVLKKDGTHIQSVDIDIFRPGVLFLHGLFSNRDCFEDLVKWITSFKSYSEEQVLNATYWTSNAASFEDNTYKNDVVGRWLNRLYSQLSDKKIVSTRYDLIGHSMGGILSRKYAQEINSDHVNRIITLDTPHSGSQLADLGKKVDESIVMTKNAMDYFLIFKEIPIVRNAKNTLEVIHKIYENCAALNDLAVKSDAIYLLNGANLQNAKGIPVHAICSYMLDPEESDIETNDISQPQIKYGSAIEINEFFISEEKKSIGKSLLDALYEEDSHDGVVSKTSQEGGLEKQYVTYETDIYNGMLGRKSNAHHTMTNKWHVTYNNILNLLRKPKTADCYSTEGFKPVDLGHHYASKLRRISSSTPDYTSLPDTTFFKLYLAKEDNDSIIYIRVRNSSNIVNNLVFTIINNDQMILSTGQSDYRFLIPDTCKGKIVVYAIGKTDNGIIVGDTAFVHWNSEVELSKVRFKCEDEITLNPSETRQLDVVGIWNNGEESMIIPTFTTDNSHVITISNDTITALSEGECLLYATYGGLFDNIKVIVYDSSSGIVSPSYGAMDVKCVNKKLIINLQQKDKRTISLEIYASDGTLAKTIDGINQMPTIIDLSKLPPAFYIARIRIGDEVRWFKYLNK